MILLFPQVIVSISFFAAIPIVYILAIVPGLMPWEKGYRFLSFCHLFGSVAPWCGSCVYHLFMNIEKGEVVYYRLLKLDMVGIWVSQSFGKCKENLLEMKYYAMQFSFVKFFISNQSIKSFILFWKSKKNYLMFLYVVLKTLRTTKKERSKIDFVCNILPL